MGLALLALALVGISAKETRGRFWGSPAGDWRSRQRRSAELVLGLTLPVVVAFGTFAAAGVEPRSVDAIVARLFGAGFFVTFAVFRPWAVGQQTLFQFYLLGRLRALLPRASPLVPVVLTGLDTARSTSRTGRSRCLPGPRVSCGTLPISGIVCCCPSPARMPFRARPTSRGCGAAGSHSPCSLRREASTHAATGDVNSFAAIGQ
jgi:hypothetical protein